ncbi:MAG TPA: DUF6445 family protein [Steroidobacteraceae bacterium]|jgi:hypothetical protein
MNLDLHPDLRIRKLAIGVERAPLLVIDNFVANADDLIEHAASLRFTPLGRFYPGIRAVAPPNYRQFVVTRLRDVLLDCLGVRSGSLDFSMCHYSIVTTPPEQLLVPQRIPHIDSLATNALASIHYLFKQDLGGTAFYRHRRTGFEVVDASRNEAYFSSLRDESVRLESADHGHLPGYINGDTELFEQIARQDGVFNRMLVYRRNSLHSGCIDAGFVPDPNPRTGRLSINSFIDLVP